MNRQRTTFRAATAHPPGFSLVEVLICTVIVGTLMVAALRTVGSTKVYELSTFDRSQAERLAADLMREIMRQAYQDPGTSPVFGPEPGETTGNRSLFNDVDDYLGWTESPPTDRNGNTLVGFESWTRTVNVEWADPTTFAATVLSNTGLKRITVTASRPGRTSATLVAYRSIAWADTLPTPTDFSGNHPPVAVALGSHLTGSKQTNATFDGTGSSDQDGDTLSYVWDFGDGNKATTATATHLYNVIGTYTCILTVYDGRGGQSTARLTVTVTP